MTIPGYQDLMLPALRLLGDGADHTPREVIALLAEEQRITDGEREEMLPSGRGHVFDSRVHWAVTYLKHAGLVEKPRRAVWRSTDEGRRVLTAPPHRIDARYLRQYPAFVAWQTGTAAAANSAPLASDDTAEAPEEALDRITTALRRQIAGELLAAVKAGSPYFFEHLVVELLVRMRYGGSYAEAARVTRATGDGGIDGVINEDRLGLDVIYVQAKRWDNVVGRPEIQKFAGSLDGERARKGVFITTSGFTPDALDYVKRIDKRIVLIGGLQLAELMIEHGVGVTKGREFVIPRIDLDFFDE